MDNGRFITMLLGQFSTVNCTAIQSDRFTKRLAVRLVLNVGSTTRFVERPKGAGCLLRV